MGYKETPLDDRVWYTVKGFSSRRQVGRGMILTITLNAAVARTLVVPSLTLGHRHRAPESMTLAGGKGVNVARSLRTLDVPVLATGFAGGRHHPAEPGRELPRRPRAACQRAWNLYGGRLAAIRAQGRAQGIPLPRKPE